MGDNMRPTVLLLVVAVAVVFTVNLATGQRRRGSGGRFCPKEKNKDRCKANENQYKCGVFYKRLVKRRPLTYIGALPDDLTNKNKPQWKRILGDTATRESFDNFPCDDDKETRANSRCYTIMNRLANKDLDTCDDTLLNHRGRGNQTLGDTLCGQIFRFLSKTPRKADIFENGIKGQQVTFQYSHCGIGWKEVNNDGQPLVPKEDICCYPSVHPQHPKGYYRCNDEANTNHPTC